MNSFLLLILTSIITGVCIPLVGIFMAKIGIIEPFSISIMKFKIAMRPWRVFSPTIVKYSSVYLDNDITIMASSGSSTSEPATMTSSIFSFPAIHRPQAHQLLGFIASVTASPITITEKAT